MSHFCTVLCDEKWEMAEMLFGLLKHARVREVEKAPVTPPNSQFIEIGMGYGLGLK